MDHVNVERGVPRPAGAYSHGVVVGGVLFTAGQGPISPDDGKVVEGGIAEQTTQVLRNLEGVLAARGRTLADVVKVTAHLADVRRDFAGFDEVCRAMFPEPFPARTTVGSDLPGMLVEIDVVALA